MNTEGERDYLELAYGNSCIHSCDGCSMARPHAEDNGLVPAQNVLNLSAQIRRRFSHAMHVFMVTPLLSMDTSFVLPKEVFYPTCEVGLALDLPRSNSDIAPKIRNFMSRLSTAFSGFGPADDVDLTVEFHIPQREPKFMYYQGQRLLGQLFKTDNEKKIGGNVMGLGVSHNENNLASSDDLTTIQRFFNDEHGKQDAHRDGLLRLLPKGYTLEGSLMTYPDRQDIGKQTALGIRESFFIRRKRDNRLMECVMNWRYTYNATGFGTSIGPEGIHNDVRRGGINSLFVTPRYVQIQHSSGNMRESVLRKTHVLVDQVLSGLPEGSSYTDFITRLKAAS